MAGRGSCSCSCSTDSRQEGEEVGGGGGGGSNGTALAGGGNCTRTGNHLNIQTLHNIITLEIFHTTQWKIFQYQKIFLNKDCLYHDTTDGNQGWVVWLSVISFVFID